MRYLFYFVHPAKFHFFRVTINQLKAHGHQVDIIITGRDILEELVINEGWKYTKIFPNGRKIKGVHVYISASIFLVLTILKLLKLTHAIKYDLFVSDDLTAFIGRSKGIASIFVTDDDLSAVPESWILMAASNYIFAPNVCELGKYNSKKVGYFGFKSLAHLHPNHFKADKAKLDSSLKVDKPFFFIRTVSATSTHDIGKKGLSNEILRRIIPVLETKGLVILNSERVLPDDLQKYVLNFHKNDVAHYLYYASIFISDSTTMCAEAAILGTPSIEFDDWYADFKQYLELNGKYELLFGYNTKQILEMLEKINELLSMHNLKAEFERRRRIMLSEKIDVSAFLIWIVENYPGSVKEYFKDIHIQKRFI